MFLDESGDSFTYVLIKTMEKWSNEYLTPTTSFITMDVTDLYTMISQEGGITAIKRLMEACGLNQIDGVKRGIILALTRFVMTNNYFFFFDDSYYKQIRGGAMGSQLTLTVARMNFRNKLDRNIKFSGSIGRSAEYLDMKLENSEGRLVTEVFHKPSHEPYFLSFTSIHAQHISVYNT